MSLALSMGELERLLVVPMDERDVRWIHSICTVSRMIHLNVWRFCPERKYVESNVVKLLKRAQNELRSMANCGDFTPSEIARINQYLQNIDNRIDNIRSNYLEGRPSAFRPDDSLSEPPAQAL